MRAVNCTITQADGSPTPVGATLDATLNIDTDVVTYAGVVKEPGRLIYTLGNDFGPGWGANLSVIAPGCAPWTARMTVPLGQTEGPAIQLEAGSNPFRDGPARPTRAQVIGFQGSMQGLRGFPEYWEGVIAWFPPERRREIYALKHAKGDTHCGVQLSGAYKEPGQYYTNYPGKDWTQDLPGFRAQLLEVIQAGFWPWVPLAGDGLHFDPEGLTYGQPWLVENLPAILEAVCPLIPYCLFSPGYDGVISYDESTQQFGPWSLDQLEQFLAIFRQMAPDGYLSIEPAAGPLGGILPDFLTPAGYDALDCYLNEFASPPWLETRRMTNANITWQSADRMLGPAFVRPPDMPPDVDPDAPFGPHSPKWRLRTPTSRGLPVACGFEVCTYEAVRGMPLDEQQRQVEYVHRCGYAYMG